MIALFVLTASWAVTPRDLAEWTSDCLAGTGPSCVRLGSVYLQGAPPRVPVNLAEAGRWLSRACDLGVLQGCFGLAAVRETLAREAGQELSTAAALYDRCCAGGMPRACAAGAVLRERGEVAGDPVPLRELACNGDHVESCLALGAHREKAREPEAAVDAYVRACDHGAVAGCAALGALRLSGPRSVRDRTSAGELLSGACAAKLGGACGLLADATERGWVTEADSVAPLELRLRGCDLAHGPSCFDAALDLRRGPEADEALAEALRSKACVLGVPAACRRSW